MTTSWVRNRRAVLRRSGLIRAAALAAAVSLIPVGSGLAVGGQADLGRHASAGDQALANGEPSAATPTPEVLSEMNIGAHHAQTTFPYDLAFDPIVATHPTDPNRMAISYQGYQVNSGSCSTNVSGLRVTDDGGQTWHEATGFPWQGSGRAPNWHSSIAWGPGPTPGGPARLYWVDTTVAGCDYTQHRFSFAYSDDEGTTWSTMFVENDTPATLGGFPDISVDRDPASPNYGVVYAAYNWFPDAATNPGLRLLASTDFGATWESVEIPPVGGLSRYPFKYRISYRLRTAPDGSVYVVFCQYDSPDQSETHVGRVGFALTHVQFDRATQAFHFHKPHMVRLATLNSFTLGGLAAPGTTDHNRLAVQWTYGLDVDPATGSVYLALPDYVYPAPAGKPRGRIYIGRSDDQGNTWSWRTLPRLPAVDGLPQSPTKPSLAVRNNVVFVGVHGLVDVPYGTKPKLGAATIGNDYAVSYNGGATFTRPVAISGSRWNTEALANNRNRAGLRDRADFTADGRIIYVYGDGRLALPKPSDQEGRSQIFAALISLAR